MEPQTTNKPTSMLLSAHTITTDDTLKALNTSTHGLSQHEAQRRLNLFGAQPIGSDSIDSLLMFWFDSPIINIWWTR